MMTAMTTVLMDMTTITGMTTTKTTMTTATTSPHRKIGVESRQRRSEPASGAGSGDRHIDLLGYLGKISPP